MLRWYLSRSPHFYSDWLWPYCAYKGLKNASLHWAHLSDQAIQSFCFLNARAFQAKNFLAGFLFALLLFISVRLNNLSIIFLLALLYQISKIELIPNHLSAISIWFRDRLHAQQSAGQFFWILDAIFS